MNKPFFDNMAVSANIHALLRGMVRIPLRIATHRGVEYIGRDEQWGYLCSVRIRKGKAMSFTHLTPPQRYQIERQRAEGKSATIIARYLGVHRSTVYREQGRGLVRGRYCAKTSHQRTLKRRAISAAESSNPLPRALARNP